MKKGDMLHKLADRELFRYSVSYSFDTLLLYVEKANNRIINTHCTRCSLELKADEEQLLLFRSAGKINIGLTTLLEY